MSFTARFSGTPCAECGLRITEGQRITGDAASGYVHVEPPCPDNPLGPQGDTKFQGTTLKEMGY